MPMAKEVVWQNKDVTSKVMAEHFKEKSLTQRKYQGV